MAFSKEPLRAILKVQKMVCVKVLQMDDSMGGLIPKGSLMESLMGKSRGAWKVIEREKKKGDLRGLSLSKPERYSCRIPGDMVVDSSQNKSSPRYC